MELGFSLAIHWVLILIQYRRLQKY